MDFELIARAGLTQREFAEVAGVSRSTVNLWVSGKMNPHRYISGHIDSVLSAIEARLHSGELPFTQRDSRARISALQAIVQQQAAA